VLAVLAACAACQCAVAEPADAPVVSMETASMGARGENLPRIEVSRSTLPRLEGLDGGTSGPRLDFTVLSPQRSSVGLAFGMSGFAAPQPPAGQPANLMNLDVGLRWRHTTDSNYQVDVAAWRRMSPQPDAYMLVQSRQPTAYLARVELNLGGTTTRSGLVAGRSFIGLQLESGARISLKRKDGGTMLYYRTRF
jgi:hypothetical protein